MNCESNVIFLVSSFDKYAACWMPFCHGFHKYWPDCPYPLYFITNFQKAPCGNSFAIGQDKGWANNLLNVLSQVETPYVLYAQEDYWLSQPVSQQNIADYVSLLESDAADYIRLYPAPGPDDPYRADERLGTLANEAPYRASLQLSLWRKTVLESLLQADETGWDFETRGSKRSVKYGKRFLCVTRRDYGVSYVFTAIVDGEWTLAAREYGKAEGLEVDFGSLPKKPLQVRLRRRFRRSAHRFKRRILNTIWRR